MSKTRCTLSFIYAPPTCGAGMARQWAHVGAQSAGPWIKLHLRQGGRLDVGALPRRDRQCDVTHPGWAIASSGHVSLPAPGAPVWKAGSSRALITRGVCART